MLAKETTKKFLVYRQREFILHPRSLRNKDEVKTTSVVGAKNIPQDRHINPNSKEIFGDKLMRPSSKYSRWRGSYKLRPFTSPDQTISGRAFSDKCINGDPKVCRIGDDILHNDTESVKVDFKTLLVMFLRRSSIFALNQVGNSTTLKRKVFWSFIMIFGLLGSGVQIVQYLGAYFSYPVVINIDSVNKFRQEFPAVTVCNLNPVRKEFLSCLSKEFNHTECESSEEEDVKLTHNFVVDTDDMICSLFGYFSSLENPQNILWEILFRKQSKDSLEFFGHQKQDFIRHCLYDGESCDIDEEFSSTVDYEYGNCFTFNSANGSKPPRSTSKVGAKSGLEIELDLEIEKYAPFTRSVGARVEVHDPYLTPNIKERGVNVGPGLETSISLTKRKMLRLPHPYKDNCYEYGVGDNMLSCFKRCTANTTLALCSCATQVPMNNIRMCDFSKMSDLCCVASLDPKDYNCDCQLSCEETDFSMNVFSAVWPSKTYYDASENETGGILSTFEIRETRLLLNVYYDTLETEVYQQKPKYQSSELFSQIGGQMGLWLGLSLVAIFECIENFVVLWRFRAQNLKKLRPTSKK